MPKGNPGEKRKPLSEEHKIKLSEIRKGKPAWNKGKKGCYKRSEETLKKMREVQVGERSTHWKGDKVGYSALHEWVNKLLGKAKKCSKCGTEDGKIEWANKDHNYRRNTKDFVELCIKCHGKYDKDNGLRRYRMGYRIKNINIQEEK